jgi:hypothetical protein
MRQSENCELAECVSNRWPKVRFENTKNAHESLAFPVFLRVRWRHIGRESFGQKRDGYPKLALHPLSAATKFDISLYVVAPKTSEFLSLSAVVPACRELDQTPWLLPYTESWGKLHFGRRKVCFFQKRHKSIEPWWFLSIVVIFKGLCHEGV